MRPYKPIDCNFYDELVLLAMHKTRIIIIPNTLDITEAVFIEDIITTKDKEEYLRLSEGSFVRLDAIEGKNDHILFLSEDAKDLTRTSLE